MLVMKSEHQQIPIYTATLLSCKFGRNYDREMSQCFLCMLWFHTECTDSINTQSIWACNNCRCLPQTVVSLKQQLFELHNTMSNILNNQYEFYSNICQVSVENEKLKAENKTLQKQLYKYRIQAYNRLSNFKL